MVASRRNAGVIRPRQFETRATRRSAYDDGSKHPRGLLSQKQLTILVGVAVTLIFLYFLSSPPFFQSSSSVEVSSDSHEMGNSPLVDKKDDEKASDVSDEEDEEDMEEDEDDGDFQSQQDEEGEETEIDETEAETEAEESVDAEGPVSQPDEEIEDSVEDSATAISLNTRKRLRIPPPKIRLTLDSYLHNAGKKAVTIEPTGSYKYVLVQATDYNGETTLMVQGCPVDLGTKCKHPVAAKLIEASLKQYGLAMQVVGGGRITRHGLKKAKRKDGLISIFGYSKSFGRCDDCNERACALIAAAYPDYVVRWSNQGYTEKDEYRYKNDFTKCST
mmetsp:Transcript_11285/g.12798  ORF Transcript_11285/g.12798 Transcript_11285/m.12798 type:complete len:332 (+) Transcript_11285:186-1181(+)